MNASQIDSAMARIRIDQLVANELCETSRAELIQWLEESKERWRDLGLAFLESQVWTNSLAELESRPSVSTPILVPESEPAEYSMKRMIVGLILAASLMLTFLGGVKWAERPNINGDTGSLAHVNDGAVERSKTADNDKQKAAPRENLAAQSPVNSMEINAYLKNASGALEKVRMPVTAAVSASRSAADSERTMRWLEDHGFAVSTEQRFLPATLPDGREVMLPYDQVRAKYVGKTVY